MTLFEVGPRDGLQNEKLILSLADKLWLIQSLLEAGIQDLEAGAFVRQDKVPQMASSDEVQEQLVHQKLPGRHWFLVPNLKGLERALAKSVTHVAFFAAVTESFNKNNIGMSVDQSLSEMKKMVDVARARGLKIRAYISTVWGCPFEGRVAEVQALRVIDQILKLDVDQVSIGDTIGVATPQNVKSLLKILQGNLHAQFSNQVAVHFHDTRGTALANAAASAELGVQIFDSSIGGLGGCPFAPGASGNLATEDLAYFFKENGVETGVHYAKLCETSLELSRRMNQRPLSSRAVQAYAANCQKNLPWDV